MHSTEQWLDPENPSICYKTPVVEVHELGYDDISPLSEYDDFMRMDIGPDGYATNPLPSPLLPDGQSMLDWTQVAAYHFDPNYNPLCDVVSSPMASPRMSSHFQQNVFMSDFEGHYMPDQAPNVTQISPQLPPTPGNFAHRRIDSVLENKSTAVYSSKGQESMPSDSITPAQDAWSVFRCNPIVPSSGCPKTARANLEQLESSLKNHDSWLAWQPQDEDIPRVAGDYVVIAPQDMLRDKLLAITQTFLHKALDTHKEESNAYEARSSSNFIILPPTRVLQLFLASYTGSFEQFYAVTPNGTLDVNDMMRTNNDRAASLLILLMIAQGASIIPGDGQSLACGLMEACRISLFDVVEKNIMMASDHVVLHSALLFTAQAAWSGDKWLMDIAMGQRGMVRELFDHTSSKGT